MAKRVTVNAMYIWLAVGAGASAKGALFYNNLLIVEECTDAVYMHHLMLNLTQ